tara:strand:+ start:5298 stop:6167 length:870 start_codon:yes stop_codon:yes gene_type:complete
MRILVAIVHHWNPSGGGKHSSLRPNFLPRKIALQEQLRALKLLGPIQGTVNFSSLKFEPVNAALGHAIDIKLITDGNHSVIEHLDEPYQNLFEEVSTEPSTSFHLGFEAQKFLASQLDKQYNLYCYLEDDLIIQDPLFFHKIVWFNNELGNQKLVLPHRFEVFGEPQSIQKLYIDGPTTLKELNSLIPNPPKPLVAGTAAGRIIYESPKNPHSGCFFLTYSQLKFWSEQSSWLDKDTSYISPLESSATLGIAKNFTLYKPTFEYAAWLEIRHWGIGFIQNIQPPVNNNQ